MAVTSFASGTQSATVGTEHSLTSVNESGVFILYVDTVNMQANDVLELRIKKIVLTSGTKRVLAYAAFYGDQIDDDTMKMSIPIPNDLTDTNSIEFTLNQTFGTSRNFPWKVLKIN